MDRPDNKEIQLQLFWDYQFNLPGSTPWLLIAAAASWGLAYGAYSVLFQVAIAQVSGAAANAAQSAVVTVWNLSIASGGAIGGVILATWGPGRLLPTAAMLTAVAIPLAVAIAAMVRRHNSQSNIALGEKSERKQQDAMQSH